MTDAIGAGSIPLSSLIVQTAGEKAEQNGETLATPENVNKVADQVDEQVAQAQQNQAQQQEAKRSLAVGVSAAQQQQELAEIYVEQSTGQEVENN
ncbi:hypothetical protein HR060_10030 [Catenovulum sp. SM1970]|uniref:hypothetical protein n=1 Tax=Marinifaba aquimaris TaxID=2741323 RepID=UPI0015741226|nr:hypothetical protein [Marinifaba aquimaris]NTS77201.1 hypothetical protein [Marinifaba aquimaris]